MATNTVVCSECRADAAPGRFACTECGAVLALVGAAPRRRAARRAAGSPATSSGASAPQVSLGTAAEGAAVPGGENAAPAARPSGTLPTGESGTAAVALATAREPEPPATAAAATLMTPEQRTATIAAASPAASPEVPGHEIDEDAPLAAAAARRAANPVDAPAPTPRTAPAGSASQAVPLRQSPFLGSPAASVAVAAWPSVPEFAPIPAPEPRSPAGRYLEPSAVLPPLDAPAVGRTGHVHAENAADPGAEGSHRASLAETLDAFGITGDTPRRLIGGGAAVAMFGFVLPWAEVVIGSGLAGSYWARWGMAGPGHWIIVGLLATEIVIALVRHRLSRIPVGPIAIGLGALLVGLVWPYLFGVIGHSVGVWLVVIGAIVLVVGGILDLRRHGTASPGV